MVRRRATREHFQDGAVVNVTYASNRSKQSYDSTRLKSDWGDNVNGSTSRAYTENGALWTALPAGKVGYKNGVGWRAPIKPMSEATLQYDILFPERFEWTKGGKLPGLCGGTGPTGCEKDRNKNANGWSCRVMWRRNATMESYCYWPDRANNCGDGLKWDVTMKRGVWQTIRMYIKMNDPGKANGVNTVWVDGRQVLSRSDLKWRNHDRNTDIDTVLFHIFYGGGDCKSKLAAYMRGDKGVDCFEPRNDQTIGFKNIFVWPGKVQGTSTPPKAVSVQADVDEPAVAEGPGEGLVGIPQPPSKTTAQTPNLDRAKRDLNRDIDRILRELQKISETSGISETNLKDLQQLALALVAVKQQLSNSDVTNDQLLKMTEQTQRARSLMEQIEQRVANDAASTAPEVIDPPVAAEVGDGLVGVPQPRKRESPPPREAPPPSKAPSPAVPEVVDPPVAAEVGDGLVGVPQPKRRQTVAVAAPASVSAKRSEEREFADEEVVFPPYALAAPDADDQYTYTVSSWAAQTHKGPFDDTQQFWHTQAGYSKGEAVVPSRKTVYDGGKEYQGDWVSLSLGQDAQIHRLRIMASGFVYPYRRPRDFAVFTSMDGVSWRRVLTVVDAELKANVWAEYDFNPTVCRHVRLGVNKVGRLVEDDNKAGICIIRELEWVGKALSDEGSTTKKSAPAPAPAPAPKKQATAPPSVAQTRKKAAPAPAAAAPPSENGGIDAPESKTEAPGLTDLPDALKSGGVSVQKSATPKPPPPSVATVNEPPVAAEVGDGLVGVPQPKKRQAPAPRVAATKKSTAAPDATAAAPKATAAAAATAAPGTMKLSFSKGNKLEDVGVKVIKVGTSLTKMAGFEIISV